MEAYVEQIVRERLLAGLCAVVNEFDFGESRPKVRYPNDAPIPIEIQGELWKHERCEEELTLKIVLAPATPWFRIPDRVEVMKVIDQRLEELTEITLYDGSRWRQIEKYNSMFAPNTPGEIYNTCAFYERLP